MKLLAHSSQQDTANRRVYHNVGVERVYSSWLLNRVEAITLLKHQHAFAGRDVLDIGIGTGRTAIYLAPLARAYEAVDYSPVMVERVRATLPSVSVRLADMRDLSPFGDQSFDFCFGPNNVLDSVGHEDRLRTLSEMHRVLRDDGVFVFSSHNRDYRHAWRAPHLAFSRNPFTQAAHLARWMRQIGNHIRIKGLRRVEADHALLNDGGHDYACLHYYIDHRTQRRQLRACGFNAVDVLDHNGQSLSEESIPDASPWLMYVARRTSIKNGTVKTFDTTPVLHLAKGKTK